MKKTFFIGVIFASIFTIYLVSCNNNEGGEICKTEAKERLQEYAKNHNDGLEYIKLDAEKNSGTYTKSNLDLIFEKYVIHLYGKELGSETLHKISSIKELAFNGVTPSLQQTRNCDYDSFTDFQNTFALEALNECMNDIAICLSNVDENKLLDNKPLLDNLHNIINNVYTSYIQKCSSETDADALTKTFGVLYGSIEYWTNSNNIESWTKINYENKTTDSTIYYSPKTPQKGTGNDKKDDNNKKLSKSEWVQTVAAADAIGALVSGPAAVACSAGAALYFDVE